MKKFTVSAAESGQHTIKYVKHLLPKAQNGFLHKMLRKKNITVNGKKADGYDPLSEGDEVCIWFSDETFEMLAKGDGEQETGQDTGFDNVKDPVKAPVTDTELNLSVSDHIIYEDEHLILFNKPPGMLSQKAKDSDVSANEVLLEYLRQKDEIPSGFVPSVCNRLDRNTSGLLLFAKTYGAARALQELLKVHDTTKLYLAPVIGEIHEEQLLKAYWGKDQKSNTAIIRKDPFKGSKEILTKIKPLSSNEEVTLLEVELITGKSHQIRSHLSFIGHPILGDPKYSKGKKSDTASRKGLKEYHLSRQLLHAYKLVFPEQTPEPLSHLSGKSFQAPLPEDMKKILSKLQLYNFTK